MLSALLTLYISFIGLFMRTSRQIRGLGIRRTLRLGVASLLAGTVIVGVGCREDIIEPPTVQALVYGTATVAGQPAAGRSVTARGFAQGCQGVGSALGGDAKADASGHYRILMGGYAETSSICVQVGLVSATGTDTVFAVGTVEARRDPPFDSVRISVDRATP